MSGIIGDQGQRSGTLDRSFKVRAWINFDGRSGQPVHEIQVGIIHALSLRQCKMTLMPQLQAQVEIVMRNFL